MEMLQRYTSTVRANVTKLPPQGLFSATQGPIRHSRLGEAPCHLTGEIPLVRSCASLVLLIAFYQVCYQV
jgi:hypothetical protein